MTFRGAHLYGNRPEPSVQGAFNADLPLTVVANIISFLDDDVASLARLCRTSRVLWYMTLPHLWKNVTLKSYSTIRYKDDIPEGFGSASPFSMGLNALVTKNVAGLVRSLGLDGEYGAADLQAHARAGRVSESVMILNIAVRAALDQCTHLERFRWDLDVRIQPNVYAGLAKLSRLDTLWIRFPGSRSPQPAYEIPPLPNLKSLTFTHYDPLCFPDAISTLFLHATKLQNLNMHFSPRMREQGEPSVVLTHLFRKNIAAKRILRLKRLGVYNLLNGSDPTECFEAIDPSGVEQFTSLNTFGLDEDAPLIESYSNGASAAHFIDRTWRMMVKPEEGGPKPKSCRMDHLHRMHAQQLRRFVGLERLYLVNARYRSDCLRGVHANGKSDSSPDSANGTSSEPSPRVTDDTRFSRVTPVRTPSASSTASMSLRDHYLDSICTVCGPTLKHLILPARWPLSTSMIARLIRSCPNLTQLAAAMDCLGRSQAEVLRLLVPFLSDLWAIRILASCGQQAIAEEAAQEKEGITQFFAMEDCKMEEKLARALAEHCDRPDGLGADFAKLRYVGIGDRNFEIGPMVKEVVGGDRGLENDSAEEATEAKVVYRRKVRRISESDVQHIEIWKMDSLDIV